MAEDYTYDAVTDWRKRAHELAGNVLDLESTAKKQREQVQELERENAELTREVAGLRYYIAQLERNVTAEERAYAAGVASLMVSQQAVQP